VQFERSHRESISQVRREGSPRFPHDANPGNPEANDRVLDGFLQHTHKREEAKDPWRSQQRQYEQ
jgi:hypothetical protein